MSTILIISTMPFGIRFSYSQAPHPLRSDIAVQHFLTVENNCIRIVKNPVTEQLYYLRISGEIYEIDMSGPSKQLVASAADHGVSSAAGLAVSADGTLFLVGNVVGSGSGQFGTNTGIIKKGELLAGQFVWSTVAETEPYARNGKFNHEFNAIVISPGGKYLFVNSGSRSDHGEAQQDSGPLAGLREFPITSAIFKIPIESENLVLQNDEDFLRTNGYLYADGVRNHFDLAFAANGDLFGVENSGDRDDSEELNWLREGRHYGFPWRIGTNDTPQQFPGYVPTKDPLISPAAFGYEFFHDDPDYPKPPAGITFTDPIPNSGPDADRFREPDGAVVDASDADTTIATFTAHRSPLGLVFDVENALSAEFAGDGFVLSFGTGSTVLGDASNDLLHLDLNKVSDDRYEVAATRLVTGFSGGRFDRGPVDAAMIGNSLYVLETGAPNIWKITLPEKQSSGVLPERLLVGYWHNFINEAGSLRLRNVSEDFDIINIAFAVPTQGSTSLIQFAPASFTTDSEFRGDVAFLQDQGKKVLISIGGAAGGRVQLNTAGEKQEFIDSMIDIIKDYGFDGMDIDFENQSLMLDLGDTDVLNPTTPLILNLIAALRTIGNEFGSDFILTMAPETFFVQTGFNVYGGFGGDSRAGAYLPLIHALRDKLTYIYVQHYNTGSVFGLDNVIYENQAGSMDIKRADFHVAVAEMLLAGFPVARRSNNVFPALRQDQVMIGLPAAPSAAGSGYTRPEVVQMALDYLIKGISFGGSYTIANPAGYSNFKGLMTWSINWDRVNDFVFSMRHRAYLDGLSPVTSVDGIEEPSAAIPQEFTLKQNYPNPFNPDTIIRYDLTKASFVALKVFDLLGREIVTLVNEDQPPGSYKVPFSATKLTSGIYFYQLQAGHFSEVKKMILTR